MSDTGLDRLDPREIFFDVEEIIQTFPTTFIKVTRGATVVDEASQASIDPYAELIFMGEAVVISTSGSLLREALGSLVTYELSAIISGPYLIKQGDFVKYEGILYQVSYQPKQLHSFISLKLRKFDQ